MTAPLAPAQYAAACARCLLVGNPGHRYSVSVCNDVMRLRKVGATGSLRAAHVLARRALSYAPPTQPGAVVEVETNSCHYEPGQFAFYKEPPSCAVDVQRLPRKSRKRAAKVRGWVEGGEPC